MADWKLVERWDRDGSGEFSVWLDERDGTDPGANAIVIGLGATRDAALRSALGELREHMGTVSRKLASLAVEPRYGAH